ncbi:Vacuolar protein sorting-associated protein 62 [Diatrype stigma]|uniref:Vacuolar protein sorting-associated protein 62 n=1 Tax=Diatrype stigma TaxID=117547 RepID=A0AAN9UKJ1_9PEZI
MYHLRRLTILGVFVGIVVLFTWVLPQALNPVKKSREAREAERRWVSTSPYWLDRQACRWLSLCGLWHVKADPPSKRDEKHGEDHHHHHAPELRRLWEEQKQQKILYTAKGETGTPKHSSGSGNNTDTDGLRGIPDYVLDYAPLVHLYSGEHFWPADIANHVKNMVPYADDVRINVTEPLDLGNLHKLHKLHSKHSADLFLRSRTDVEARPSWLHNWFNIPALWDDDNDDDDDDDSDWDGDEAEGRQSEEDDEHRSGDTTTWFDVDRDHPLQRISDPRYAPDGSGSGSPSHMGPRQPLPARRGGTTTTTPQQRRRRRRRERERERSAPTLTAQHKPDDSGYSRAPATLVLVDKGSGIVDAFWFFFYAYNLGQTVLGVRYGNHVGDWEHAMIRFDSGVPRAVFFSEHEGGQAYAWHAVEKRRDGGAGNETNAEVKQRPVIYSAVGSHAMYAMPGDHPYVLPFGMLRDQTDRGPLWDPRKNFRAYWYDYAEEELEPVREQPEAPTSWFHYRGRWGDQLYGLDDHRQWRLFGQYHYVTGPQGPKVKNLEREKMCSSKRCRILHSIAEGRRSTWVP